MGSLTILLALYSPVLKRNQVTFLAAKCSLDCVCVCVCALKSPGNHVKVSDWAGPNRGMDSTFLPV